MLRKRFDLVVFGQDVNEVLGFAQGLVMGSECSSLALCALLMEASELAILSCKDHWQFAQDKELSFDDLRCGARDRAVEIYHNQGDGDNGVDKR